MNSEKRSSTRSVQSSIISYLLTISTSRRKSRDSTRHSSMQVITNSRNRAMKVIMNNSHRLQRLDTVAPIASPRALASIVNVPSPAPTRPARLKASLIQPSVPFTVLRLHSLLAWSPSRLTTQPTSLDPLLLLPMCPCLRPDPLPSRLLHPSTVVGRA
jgi:hypothetical protein